MVTVSGSINLPVGAQVKASFPGATASDELFGVVVDDPDAAVLNEYSIAGLDVGLTLGGIPEPRVWTISYDVLGTGTYTSTVNVTSTSPASVPLNITVAAQPITVNFVVSGPATGGNVSVTFSGETVNNVDATPGPTTVPITFLENETALGYTVDGVDFLLETGVVPLGANRLPRNQPVTLVARPPVAGLVQTAAAAPVDNADVRVCAIVAPPAPPPPPPPPTMCNPASALASGSTNGSGVFTISNLSNVPAGTYHVWAKKGGDEDFVVLTVNPTRTLTWPSGSTITIP